MLVSDSPYNPECPETSVSIEGSLIFFNMGLVKETAKKPQCPCAVFWEDYQAQNTEMRNSHINTIRIHPNTKKIKLLHLCQV